MQTSRPTSTAYIQLLGTGLLPAAYIPPGIKLIFAAYIQPSRPISVAYI